MAEPRDFSKLDFEAFRTLASDPSLSQFERIGFPDSYRKGQEQAIFEDIQGKLPALGRRGKTVLDIGPGCSDLPHLLIKTCEKQGHRLALVDSQEMLGQLPSLPHVEKYDAMFPDCPRLLNKLAGKADAILCYSVLHYAYVDTNLFDFLDAALSLLAPGGDLLLGDIPNVSMRRRFFASENGVAFHQAFMKTAEKPVLEYMRLEPGQIDDAVLFGLLQRARAAGFHAWIVPQDAGLPMANRREDVLIHRP